MSSSDILLDQIISISSDREQPSLLLSWLRLNNPLYSPSLTTLSIWMVTLPSVVWKNYHSLWDLWKQHTQTKSKVRRKKGTKSTLPKRGLSPTLWQWQIATSKYKGHSNIQSNQRLQYISFAFSVVRWTAKVAAMWMSGSAWW